MERYTLPRVYHDMSLVDASTLVAQSDGTITIANWGTDLDRRRVQRWQEHATDQKDISVLHTLIYAYNAAQQCSRKWIARMTAGTPKFTLDPPYLHRELVSLTSEQCWWLVANLRQSDYTHSPIGLSIQSDVYGVDPLFAHLEATPDYDLWPWVNIEHTRRVSRQALEELLSFFGARYAPATE